MTIAELVRLVLIWLVAIGSVYTALTFRNARRTWEQAQRKWEQLNAGREHEAERRSPQ